ncbi:hypothetical protein A2U01_0096589, partial [Trifolium medium]|nr:hypothetical protein [Trifolium medium]
MMVLMRKKARSTQLGEILMSITMTEPSAWAMISACMAKNRIKMALEANMQQENMAVETNNVENGKDMP